jgi:hypothetical protein
MCVLVSQFRGNSRELLSALRVVVLLFAASVYILANCDGPKWVNWTVSPFPSFIKVLQQPEVKLLLFTLQRKWNGLSIVASCHVSLIDAVQTIRSHKREFRLSQWCSEDVAPHTNHPERRPCTYVNSASCYTEHVGRNRNGPLVHHLFYFLISLHNMMTRYYQILFIHQLMH